MANGNLGDRLVLFKKGGHPSAIVENRRAQSTGGRSDLQKKKFSIKGLEKGKGKKVP